MMSLVAVLIFVRYQAKKKQKVAPEANTEVEIEVKPPRKVDHMVNVYFSRWVGWGEIRYKRGGDAYRKFEFNP